jgi:hypothetical protein
MNNLSIGAIASSLSISASSDSGSGGSFQYIMWPANYASDKYSTTYYSSSVAFSNDGGVTFQKTTAIPYDGGSSFGPSKVYSANGEIIFTSNKSSSVRDPDASTYRPTNYVYKTSYPLTVSSSFQKLADTPENNYDDQNWFPIYTYFKNSWVYVWPRWTRYPTTNRDAFYFGKSTTSTFPTASNQWTTGLYTFPVSQTYRDLNYCANDENILLNTGSTLVYQQKTNNPANGTFFVYSTDGTTWLLSNSGSFNSTIRTVSNLIFSEGNYMFLAFQNNGNYTLTGSVFYSANLSTWNKSTFSATLPNYNFNLDVTSPIHWKYISGSYVLIYKSSTTSNNIILTNTSSSGTYSYVTNVDKEVRNDMFYNIYSDLQIIEPSFDASDGNSYSIYSNNFFASASNYTALYYATTTSGANSVNRTSLKKINATGELNS